MLNVNSDQFNVNEPGIPQMVKNLSQEYDVKEKKVLEVGVGWGGFAFHMAGRGARVVGIEPTEIDLKTVRNDNRLNGIEFLVGSGLDLPFEDKFFDYIFAWEVLEHIPSGTENTFFAEAFRCLKPGGVIAISTPSRNLRSIIFDPAFVILKHRHYSQSQVMRFALNNNLKVLKIGQYGKTYLAIWNLGTYFSKWILRKKSNILSFPSFLKKLQRDIEMQGWVSCVGFFQRPL